MTVEHQCELDGLRRAGALVASIPGSMREAAVPGARSRELDAFGAKRMRRAGAPIELTQPPGEIA